MKKKLSLSLLLVVFFLLVVMASSHHKQIPEPLPEQTHAQGLIEVSESLLALSTEFKTPTIALKLEKVADRQIAKMSLEEKIGQLFLARVPEKNALADLKTYHLGGYLLFGRDMEKETPDSLTKKIASYQKEADLPLFIASDEEGGTVSRLNNNPKLIKEPFKSPQEIYKKNGLTGIKEDLTKKAALLEQYGINLTLAPVADIATKSETFIYPRTLGQSVAKTSEYITESVTVMADLHLGSTLKHFPGYGNNGDSHTDIVHDSRSLAALKKEALPPFIAGIEAGADSVLIAHNIVEALDDKNPASISPNVYTFLREELDFQGVIMTDDFDMEGLKKFTTQEDAALKAINNGADLILSSTYQKQIPYLLKAVSDKKLTEAKIDASVKRVLLLKYKLNLITDY